MAPGEDLKGSPRGLLIRSWGVEGLLEPEKGKAQCTLFRDHGAFIRCLWYTKYSILVHRTPAAPNTSLPVASCLHLKQIHSACTIWFTSHSPFVHCPFASVPRPFFTATVPSARAAPTLYSVCSYTLRSLPGATSSECSREDPRHTCQPSASRHLHFLASPVRNLCLLTQLSLPLQRR